MSMKTQFRPECSGRLGSQKPLSVWAVFKFLLRRLCANKLFVLGLNCVSVDFDHSLIREFNFFSKNFFFTE